MMATQEGSVFDDLPGVRQLAVVVLGGLVLGGYAMWITADVIPRALTFIFVSVGVAGMLYRREDGRERLAYAGYVLAGLLFLTPVMLMLPRALSAGEYGRSAFELVFMTTYIAVFVVFLVLAVVVAYLSYRFS